MSLRFNVNYACNVSLKYRGSEAQLVDGLRDGKVRSVALATVGVSGGAIDYCRWSEEVL